MRGPEHWLWRVGEADGASFPRTGLPLDAAEAPLLEAALGTAPCCDLDHRRQNHPLGDEPAGVHLAAGPHCCSGRRSTAPADSGQSRAALDGRKRDSAAVPGSWRRRPLRPQGWSRYRERESARCVCPHRPAQRRCVAVAHRKVLASRWRRAGKALGEPPHRRHLADVRLSMSGCCSTCPCVCPVFLVPLHTCCHQCCGGSLKTFRTHLYPARPSHSHQVLP